MRQPPVIFLLADVRNAEIRAAVFREQRLQYAAATARRPPPDPSSGLTGIATLRVIRSRVTAWGNDLRVRVVTALGSPRRDRTLLQRGIRADATGQRGPS